MGKNIGKKIETDALETTSKRAIQKAAQATGDLFSNKIADRIRKVSKNLQQNYSKTVTNEHDKETPKERDISPEEDRKLLMA